MVHDEKKAAKIVEELSMFFFAIGARKMSSGIRRMDDQIKITFRSDYLPEYEHSILTLEKYLNEPKNEAFEDIYWQLAGSGDPGESTQLLLLGMMVDRYKIEHFENEVKLSLYKEICSE